MNGMSKGRVALLVLIAVVLWCSAASAAGKLTDEASQASALARESDPLKVIVVMAQSPESALGAVRPQEVGARLRALAAQSQGPLTARLKELQAQGEVKRVRPLPIINGVAITATKRAVEEISGRADVGYVGLDSINHIHPVGRIARLSRRPASVPWSITAIRAEEAWKAFGYRGEGVVVANMDTGVNVTHPALGANYRGGTNSFFDAINGQTDPYDDHGHGTATMSNICGNAPADNFSGVAPNATFIAAKCFDMYGGGADSDILDAANWILDPDGNPATLDQPQVVNNSWGGGSRDPWFIMMVLAWDAADIYPVFSIGNSGPGAGSANSPGDYVGILGVGATNSSNAIAWFSSRGPAAWHGRNYLKPDLCAPGVKVAVAAAGGGYGTADGTSFSCPHTSGAAALVIQKRGAMDKLSLNGLLQRTAKDLGAAGPDNDYGYGLLDVYAALSPPTLEWAGGAGYVADGVDPDTGAPGSTAFTFKVVYRDPGGQPPSLAECAIQRKTCTGWVGYKNVRLAKESGDYVSGAVYSGATTVRNEVYQYRFQFMDASRAEATGDPAVFQPGPTVSGWPMLCWRGTTGYVSDGVNPDSGPLGTKFKFQVVYMDSKGDAPTTRQLVLRRNGVIYKTKDMSGLAGGDYRTGKVFSTSEVLSESGTYEYRFKFADAEGKAHGDPNNWQTGPVITGPTCAVVTSLAGVPTNAGVQVTFSLSSTAEVTATVLNLAGRPIKTIAADQPLAAGLQTLAWDGKAANGLTAPAGLYVVRVTARNAEGGQSTALATVALR